MLYEVITVVGERRPALEARAISARRLAPREAEEAAGENPAERAASFALYRPQESGPDLGQFASYNFV